MFPSVSPASQRQPSPGSRVLHSRLQSERSSLKRIQTIQKYMKQNPTATSGHIRFFSLCDAGHSPVILLNKPSFTLSRRGISYPFIFPTLPWWLFPSPESSHCLPWPGGAWRSEQDTGRWKSRVSGKKDWKPDGPFYPSNQPGQLRGICRPAFLTLSVYMTKRKTCRVPQTHWWPPMWDTPT